MEILPILIKIPQFVALSEYQAHSGLQFRRLYGEFCKNACGKCHHHPNCCAAALCNLRILKERSIIIFTQTHSRAHERAHSSPHIYIHCRHNLQWGGFGFLLIQIFIRTLAVCGTCAPPQFLEQLAASPTRPLRAREKGPIFWNEKL